MAKKRSRLTTAESLENLAELCGSLNLPDDAFDGDLRDAADDAANIAYETVKKAVMLEKLEFLHYHGFQLGRLKELIKYYAQTGGNPE